MSGDSDKVTLEKTLEEGEECPRKSHSMKELETARRPGGKEWMSEGKMVRDEAGELDRDQITQALYTVLGGLGVALRELWKLYVGSGWSWFAF